MIIIISTFVLSEFTNFCTFLIIFCGVFGTNLCAPPTVESIAKPNQFEFEMDFQLGINCRPPMNPRTSARSARPLPNDYNKINDLDLSPTPVPRRRRRLNCTKTLAIVCVILVSLLIVCVYYLFQKDYRFATSRTNNENNVCDKKDCIIAASSILQSMENSFYPCDDFFLYSCGHSLPYEQQTDNNLINQIQYKHEIDLKTSIESLHDDKQPKYIRKVYKYYKSCLNEDRIEKQDIKPLNDLIDELGGWPVVKGSKWPVKSAHYLWINIYMLMRKLGVNPNSFFNLIVDKDLRNSSRWVPVIDRPDFALTADKLNDSHEYFDLMVRIAEMMGADRVDAQNDLLQVVVLEKELIQMSLREEDLRNKTYYSNNYMTVRQMQMFAPNINWTQLLSQLMAQNIDLNMEIIVLVPTYVRLLNQKVHQTEPRVLANYLIWKVIYQYLPLLSRRWREPLQKYERISGRADDRPERWQTCVKQIQTLMAFPLANIYMKKHFNIRKDVEVISAINYIKESFIDLIDKNQWMSDSVRAKAKHKILSISLRIGFPKELLDEELMDRWLDVDIKEDYFKNTIRLSLFSIDNQMKKLFPSDDSTNPESTHKMVSPADIVLKYSPKDNALLISAALINGFLNEELPKYLSYGSLGLLISNELVKVYDEDGRQYDEDGSRAYWWDSWSDRTFDNFVSCYDRQIKDVEDAIYSMNTRDRSQLIRQLIVDTTVFQQTILAYKKFVSENTAEPGLTGLSLAAEQLFWVNSAKTYYSILKGTETTNNVKFNFTHRQNWFTRRTEREQKFIIAIILLSVLSLALLITVAVLASKQC